MLFTRLATLRDDRDRREVIYAKNLPQLADKLIGGIADGLGRRTMPIPRAGPIAGEAAD
jgi:hypothetical protein